ncbi:6-phosphogluconate dehydrogenase [Candidatus Poribacteria bacterium]|nr:6-phosphogluconate dehydrogenase [Candidatus Poribacteria bacterium]
MAQSKPAAGLIGIGLVGTVLAERLLRAGYTVVGADIDAGRQRALTDLGGLAVGSPREVADRVGRVVLSLFDSDAVRLVVEGDDGLLSAAVPPRHIIDTTTGSPDETQRLAERLGARGIHLIDATVSGSSAQLREDKAALMVGGEVAAVAACDDLLRAMSSTVRHVGPPGSGAKAKLATNVLIGLNRAVLAEALAFAESLGLDLASFLDLARVAPSYSVAMDVKGDRMVAGDFAPDSRVRQHRKDLRLILDAAREAGQGMPLTEAHAGLLDALIDAGDGDLDNAAIIRALRRLRR